MTVQNLIKPQLTPTKASNLGDIINLLDLRNFDLSKIPIGICASDTSFSSATFNVQPILVPIKVGAPDSQSKETSVGLIFVYDSKEVKF